MYKYFKKVGVEVQKYFANPSNYSVISPYFRVVSGYDPYHDELIVSIPRTSHMSSSVTLDDMVQTINTYALTVTGTGPYTATVTSAVVNGSQYIISAPSGVTVTYQGEVVSGIITASTSNQFTLTKSTTFSGNLVVSKIVKSLYQPEYKEGGTWIYNPDQQIERWVGRYTFEPEWMSTVGNRLITFKNGRPYIHGSGAVNTFYGITYDSAFAVAHSEAGNGIKLYTNLGIEGDKPDIAHVRSEQPNIQSTDIISSDWSNKVGVYYVELYRDRLSPNVSGDVNAKLMKGDKIKADIGKVMIVYTQPTSIKKIKFLNILYDVNQGQVV